MTPTSDKTDLSQPKVDVAQGDRVVIAVHPRSPKSPPTVAVVRSRGNATISLMHPTPIRVGQNFVLYHQNAGVGPRVERTLACTVARCVVLGSGSCSIDAHVSADPSDTVHVDAVHSRLSAA